VSVYVTSKIALDGISNAQRCRNSLEMGRGDSEFTLILPTRCEGYPGITFHADGKHIGDIQFGSGDSVLR
jgi:hypothetical protein